MQQRVIMIDSVENSKPQLQNSDHMAISKATETKKNQYKHFLEEAITLPASLHTRNIQIQPRKAKN